MAVSRWRAGLIAGLAAGMLYIISRGLALGRLPLLGPHDTLTFFGISLAIMGLFVSYSPMLRGVRWFGAVVGAAAGAIVLVALTFRPLNMPLPQILDTLWFELHVVVAFFGYALFAIGGVVSAAYLLTGVRSYLDVYFKTALVGWTFFSASMISGGIWGYYAWGTYWLWTPKELWTSVLWLFYAMALHVRLKGARWDNLSAWLGIAGVFVMLFTYLGVSMLMKSSHSF
ncbi:MAG: cytochrome c biogenesis protein CcsA [Deltaproteobacteria bacterium]|nr:cytochrome c biogenesis protein CcsA [Deltaproteobacteria bacterium]